MTRQPPNITRTDKLFPDTTLVRSARVELVTITQAARLAETGCLFFPDANIAAVAGARHGVGARAYSLCGVSHTLSTASAMRAVIGCLTQPTQSWDAIVCPSRAIRAAIQALWSTAVAHPGDAEIGRASCRGRGCKYV